MRTARDRLAGLAGMEEAIDVKCFVSKHLESFLAKTLLKK